MSQSNKNMTLHMVTFIGSLGLMALAACSSDKVDEADSTQDGNIIKVGALMAEFLHSREDMGSTQVVEIGDFCMSFPVVNSGEYRNAIVRFNVPEFEPSIGVVTIPPDSELKWSNVLNVSQPTFYLDNIPLEKSSGSNPSSVVFDDQYNPFVAGLFDFEKGNNDLLWGSKAEPRNSKTINFDLHHNMARLKVRITVDKTNEAEMGDLDLSEGAIVSITSLVNSPVSYNRLDGSLALSDLRESLTLVTPEDPELSWDTIITDPENDNITVYTTKDFVLPPQGLPEDITRPELVITLKNGNTYSGILPYAMEVLDSEHPDPYPMTLYFLKEHILTISTVITEEPPQLEFMPVQVVDWVYKGLFSFDGHQSGIYKANEFYNFIRDYNAGEVSRLDRYGMLTKPENSDTDLWVFQFWNSVVLDYTEIYRKIPQTNIPFIFSFNGFTISVRKNDGTITPVNADSLYKILLGTLSL